MTSSDPCPTVRARVAFDHKHGRTTSEATKEFIRWTCKCEECTLWRAGRGRWTEEEKDQMMRSLPPSVTLKEIP